MEIYDMHCHLDLIKNFHDFVSRYELKTLKILAVTTTPRAYQKEVELCSKINNIKVALGLHPQLINERQNEIFLLMKLLPKARFVGEIGLDFSKQYYSSKDSQIECFNEIIRGCSKYEGKVISIHCLRAEKKVLDIIEKYRCTNRNKCILHWYTGSIKQLERAIELGCYFSVNSRMLLSENGKRILMKIPLDRILIESDMPFVVSDCSADELYYKLKLLINELTKIYGVDVVGKLKQNSKSIFCELEFSCGSR